MKTAEIFSPHFGLSSPKQSHTKREAVKTELAGKHVLELQQKAKKLIQGVYLLSLSLSLSWAFYFFLSY